jgi:hypothetical protein
MAIVLGGWGTVASASKSVLGKVVPGSGPNDQAGNCLSYFAMLGMPKV